MVDAVVAPGEGAGLGFTEALWVVPGTYQPQDPDTPLGRVFHGGEDDGEEAEEGGSDDGVTRLRVPPGPAPPPIVACEGVGSRGPRVVGDDDGGWARWHDGVAAVRAREALPREAPEPPLSADGADTDSDDDLPPLAAAAPRGPRVRVRVPASERGWHAAATTPTTSAPGAARPHSSAASPIPQPTSRTAPRSSSPRTSRAA